MCCVGCCGNSSLCALRRDKQKQRLQELEGEVAALSQADKGTRGERDALLQRNATLQARLCHSLVPCRP